MCLKDCELNGCTKLHREVTIENKQELQAILGLKRTLHCTMLLFLTTSTSGSETKFFKLSEDLTDTNLFSLQSRELSLTSLYPNHGVSLRAYVRFQTLLHVFRESFSKAHVATIFFSSFMLRVWPRFTFKPELWSVQTKECCMTVGTWKNF